MGSWLRVGGLAVAAIVALWLVVEIVSFIFGLVTWLVSTVLTLAVVAILLYLAYLALSKFVGGGGSSGSQSRSRSQERERERIYE